MDLATARRESYRAPGALPRVEPASLAEDLARRDFSLNALAVRLDRADWGRLVDTTGGLADLRARRIRVLHPLSFVEDPTRVFRAARFAARLGCRVDPTTRRLALHATRLDVYRALSGDRLRTELELMLAERRPVAALREAGRLGAWSLVDQRAGPRTGTVTAPRLGARPSGPGRPRTRRPDRPRPARPDRRERGPRDLDGPARPRAGPAQRDPAGAPGCARARRSPRPGARPGRRIRHTAERAGADGRVGADSCGPSRLPRPPGPTLPKLAKLAPTPGAGDRRRRRRAGCSPGAGGRRDPHGAPGGTGRRTGAKPDWCVTLADGRRRPEPRARERITHPTG